MGSQSVGAILCHVGPAVMTKHRVNAVELRAQSQLAKSERAAHHGSMPLMKVCTDLLHSEVFRFTGELHSEEDCELLSDLLITAFKRRL